MTDYKKCGQMAVDSNIHVRKTQKTVAFQSPKKCSKIAASEFHAKS